MTVDRKKLLAELNAGIGESRAQRYANAVAESPNGMREGGELHMSAKAAVELGKEFGNERLEQAGIWVNQNHLSAWARIKDGEISLCALEGVS